MNSHCHCCCPWEIAGTGTGVLVGPDAATDVAVVAGPGLDTAPVAAAVSHVVEVAVSPVPAAVYSVVAVDTDSVIVSEK